MTGSGGSWATQQLAEFLGIFGESDGGELHRRALDRMTEAFDAEVGAIVGRAGVLDCLGYPPGQAPEALLAEMATTRPDTVELIGFGIGHVAVVPAGEEPEPCSMIVIRVSERFDPDERTLLRSMGRALGLARRLGAVLESERFLRRETELHSAENQRLVHRLGERQNLALRLFDIQRRISHRAPLPEVLDALSHGAADLLDADQVTMRILLPGAERAVGSMVGGTEQARAGFLDIPIDVGVTGRAFRTNQLVVVDDYQLDPDRIVRDGDDFVHATMAMPVVVADHPVGAIGVSSHDPARRFSDAEAEILRTLAEYASQAVADATEVDALRESLDDATHRAHHDSLTGLLNRSAVVAELDDMLARSVTRDAPLTVLFVDLDRFKMINDVMGHATGDRVLIEVAHRLATTVRGDDIVARLAGDEFVVVIPGLPNADAGLLAERIVEAISMPIDLGHRELSLTVSIGVAEAHGAESGEQLLADADVAMYRAKRSGRATVVRFDANMRHEMIQRSDLERELTTALRDDQLRVFYQPYRSLVSDQIVGFEALVRWEHPTRGLLAPAEFVPLAEETGQILAIDSFVLKQATRQVAVWQGISPELATLAVSVNLSARQFTDANLVPTVDRALTDAGLAPPCLWLEITESVAMDQTEDALGIMLSLRELGLRLMVDDFGTGYSSLIYLKRFPVDALKVDRTFVDGLGTDHEDEVIVTAVVGLADALGLDVIAEGVETERQLEWLKRLGCRLAQGYLFSRPVPAPQAEALLAEQIRLTSPSVLAI